MTEEFIIDTGAAVAEAENITPLPLYDENHPMLKQFIPEYDVTRLPNPVVSNLISRLKLTMKNYNGLGLSANQCGVFERVFVIGNGDMSVACINPKVVSQSNNLKNDSEGCLSFPGLFVKVSRPDSIDVSFYDENGKQNFATFEGLTARCFLHELDHMNGIRMVEHVKPLALQMAKKKQQKMIKKIVRLAKK